MASNGLKNLQRLNRNRATHAQYNTKNRRSPRLPTRNSFDCKMGTLLAASMVSISSCPLLLGDLWSELLAFFAPALEIQLSWKLPAFVGHLQKERL
jgi:hypothetical protein